MYILVLYSITYITVILASLQKEQYCGGYNILLANTHTKIARYVAKATKIRLNHFIFLLGSIIPDLNPLLPSHRIILTKKRFNNRVNKCKEGKSLFSKSLNAGIVVHYICDYFCLAHNKQAILNGVPHSKYEYHLEKYIASHITSIETENVDFISIDQLVMSKMHIINSTENICDSISNINKIYMKSYSKHNYKYDLLFSICVAKVVTTLMFRNN